MAEHSYDLVELHLSTDPDLVRRYGRRIKNASGTYRHCRGLATKRFVTLPASEAALIDTLVAEFPLGQTVMIARGTTTWNAEAWVNVHYYTVADRNAKKSPSAVLAEAYRKAVNNAIERGILKPLAP